MARRSQACGLLPILIGLSLLGVSCGGSTTQSSTTPSSNGQTSGSSQPTKVQHVFMVMEENQNYSDVIGSSEMPYLNGLATNYGYAQSYYANTHPSIGNYFMLTTGKTITNDDGFSGTVSDDNIVRHLIKAGKTWKEYSEDLPSTGYTGGDSGGYVQHHNPLAYFSDVQNDGTQAQNLVPFSQFAIDLHNHALPNYSFIVPNDQDNSHDGSRAQADSWLQTNIDPLVKSSDFSTPGGGLLIIAYDESRDDNTMGGGKVAWVVVGPGVKKGHSSTTTYQHESTLRLVSKLIGLPDFPGASASAPDMGEFISGD